MELHLRERATRYDLAWLLGPRVLRWLLLPLALLIVVLPLNLNAYWVRVLSGMFMMGALTQSINLIAGFTGYLAFGHTVFFGLGAYVVGIMMYQFHLSFWASLVVAAIVPALYAFVLGLPLLRLRSQYFAVSTIAVLYGTRELVVNARSITLGSSGLVVPGVFEDPRTMIIAFYYMMLVLLVAATFVVWRISKSRFGFGLRAIRGDEDAAQVMGIPTTRYKVVVWTIAAAIAGLAGGLYAGFLGYLEPGNVFNILTVVKIFTMLLLGGMGSVIGPVLGAVFLEFISEILWANFEKYHMITLGAIIVVVTLFMPNGLTDVLGRLRARLTHSSEGEEDA